MQTLMRTNLATGERTSIDDPALRRALTCSGRHNQTERINLWRVHAWSVRANDHRPIGYAVTTRRRADGVLLAQPRIVAFIPGVDASSLIAAKEIQSDPDFAYACGCETGEQAKQ